MSRPVFLAPDVRGEHVVLDGAEGRHAATVRRLRAGEAVDVVDGRGTRATGSVVEVARDRVVVAVERVEVEPAHPLRVVLVQALAKGDRGELAVELATETGVDAVVPWQAERCVVRWAGDRTAKGVERWRATAREAAKQSRRSRVPDVEDVVTTAALTGRVAGRTALVLHESAELRLADAPLPEAGELLLVVGPEGGVSDAELHALATAGAVAVRLGPTVLRTSTAGAAAVAVVSARSGRW